MAGNGDNYIKRVLNCVSCYAGAFIHEFQRAFRYCEKQYTKSKFASCGEAVSVGNGCQFTENTLHVGSHVQIGDGCIFKSAHGTIHIGNHVMFGPGVHIHGGDHPIHVAGLLLDECKKDQNSDGRVVVEEDCWIGARAIILKGVTLGRGSVIGAGAIVTHDVPPYSIYVGAPAQKEWQRFSPEELEMHQQALMDRRRTDG